LGVNKGLLLALLTL